MNGLGNTLHIKIDPRTMQILDRLSKKGSWTKAQTVRNLIRAAEQLSVDQEESVDSISDSEE